MIYHTDHAPLAYRPLQRDVSQRTEQYSIFLNAAAATRASADVREPPATPQAECASQLSESG
jgi:hypothetical protein